MYKFLAVTKYEYKKLVFSLTFLIATLIAPLLCSIFIVVPIVMSSIRSDATRLVIIDQTEKLELQLRENLSPAKNIKPVNQIPGNSVGDINASQSDQLKNGAQQLREEFIFKDFTATGETLGQTQTELNELIKKNELDAYLIIPQNIETAGTGVELHSRNPSNFVANSTLEDAVNKTVQAQRFARVNIDEAHLEELLQKTPLNIMGVNEREVERDGKSGLRIGFIIGLLIFVTLTLYGTVIMGAIVAEKESRLAEILFSSAKPFELMIGKLMGVGLAGLTQLAIWMLSLIGLIGFGLVSNGLLSSIPAVKFSIVIYFFIFFLLGFFTYATVYALIGSVVSTLQEGNNFSLVPILLMLIVFYSIFPVIRDPDSIFSFWVSIAPFSGPIVMIVRIVTQPPPFWEILLSIIVNTLTILSLIWIVGRVYRIGMLMLGKRATIPEIWRWIWQD